MQEIDYIDFNDEAEWNSLMDDTELEGWIIEKLYHGSAILRPSYSDDYLVIYTVVDDGRDVDVSVVRMNPKRTDTMENYDLPPTIKEVDEFLKEMDLSK